MIDTDFEELITGQLGGNLVDVELQQDDYDIAFYKAKLTYQTKGNDNFRKTYYTLPVVADTIQYDLPASTMEIMSLIKPSFYHSDDPFTIATVNDMFNGIRQNSGDLATFELSMQSMENLDIYTTRQTPFVFDRINKTIKLLDTPNVTENWILEIQESLSDAEYRDLLWIQEWALAEAKIMLGRAYTKFQALSSPTGETSLAGDILTAEGREDKDLLLEDIKNHVDGEPTGMPFIIG